MSNDYRTVQLPESKQWVIIKSCSCLFKDVLRSMLLMFYGSMEKKGLCFKDFFASHMDNRQRNNRG